MSTSSPGEKPLWDHSAAELAAGIRGKAFSATEVARAFLQRIDETNPAVNALVDIRPEEALAQAAAADAKVAAGEPLEPLHGVPVSIKINTSQRGYASSHGIPEWAGAVAGDDAACVAALRRAGANLMGRSNSPAFAVRWFTGNDLHGRTLNPWSSAHTPGGSSGGAAAAVASGMVPIAQGNDIGGSIRFPAYCCGAVGLRPTVGLVSATEPAQGGEFDAPLSFQTMAVHGPLGWTVDDVRLGLHAMVTPDLQDPVGLPVRPPLGEPRPVKVAVVRDAGLAKPHPAVEAAIDSAAAWLGEAGYEVEEVELPLLGEAARLWSLLLYEELRTMMPEIERFGDDTVRLSLASSFAAATEHWGERPTLEAYIKGYARRGTLITRLQQYLGDDRILLTPVSAEPPFEQDADLAGDARVRELLAAQWPMQAVPVLGFPAISVPTGLRDGLPSGVQLIGGRYRENLLLHAATAIEARAERTRPPLAPSGAA
ncbi:amidase [Streptomyces sp. CB03238]|uniref:amidase n=1 Tax=Streptomyces sp. CB03238 TaxID=1907777 RepID=UPI000A11DDE9|nr:amidase [Streptomyces sp. CB03238]ORT57049.1 amidase [Streptomyces sp. CB03238]